MGPNRSLVSGEAAANGLYFVAIASIMGSICLVAFSDWNPYTIALAIGGVLSAAPLCAAASVVENVGAIRLMTAEMLEQRRTHDAVQR